jgi:hypothetical protein
MSRKLNQVQRLFVRVVLTAAILSGSLDKALAQDRKIWFEFENGSQVGYYEIGMVCKNLIDSERKNNKNGNNGKKLRDTLRIYALTDSLYAVRQLNGADIFEILDDKPSPLTSFKPDESPLEFTCLGNKLGFVAPAAWHPDARELPKEKKPKKPKLPDTKGGFWAPAYREKGKGEAEFWQVGRPFDMAVCFSLHAWADGSAGPQDAKNEATLYSTKTELSVYAAPLSPF